MKYNACTCEKWREKSTSSRTRLLMGISARSAVEFVNVSGVSIGDACFATMIDHRGSLVSNRGGRIARARARVIVSLLRFNGTMMIDRSTVKVPILFSMQHQRQQQCGKQEQRRCTSTVQASVHVHACIRAHI